MQSIRGRTPDRRRRRLARLIGLAIAFAALLGARLWPAADGTVRAQSTLSWSTPYCGTQPRITSIFDHHHPSYLEDGILMLFSGADIASCGDRPGYDGHSGWDFARRSRDQGCGSGWRSGQHRSLVFAAEDGEVRRSRWQEPQTHDGRDAGYGLSIELDHGEDRGSLYGHLAALFVDEGEAVQRGQLIGALGDTGNSSGPHLHFQAGRGPSAHLASHSFDPYGWDRRYDAGPPDPPGFSDPHRGNGWSQRLIVPGQSGPACPSSCGIWIVDDASPEVELGCAAAPDCPDWQFDARGYGFGHHWVHPRAGKTDYVATYRCGRCGPGSYLVDAFVPSGASIANTHVARYEVGAELSVLDQHTEGGLWQPLGIFTFDGTPTVRLTDRGDRYDYSAEHSQKVGADALRFTRICDNLPPGTPRIDRPDEPGGGPG